MNNSISLDDLKRLAIAKHGEDEAYLLACKFGNPNHKESWRKAIAINSRTPEDVLDRQIWQKQIQMQFFGRTFKEENLM